MDKPDALIRQSGDEKLGVEERMFEEGQLNLIDNTEVSDTACINTKIKVDCKDKFIETVVLGDLLALDGIDLEDADIEAQDIELEGIDCAEWEKNMDRLLKVPEEYKKEVLRQCHDSKVTRY